MCITYTHMGAHTDMCTTCTSPILQGTSTNPGVYYNSVAELCRLASKRSENWHYNMKMSILEIYEDQIRDLLNESQSEKLLIKERMEWMCQG